MFMWITNTLFPAFPFFKPLHVTRLYGNIAIAPFQVTIDTVFGDSFTEYFNRFKSHIVQRPNTFFTNLAFKLFNFLSISCLGVVLLNKFVDFASVFLYIAYFVAFLLAILGMFMLMGGTAKLMSFVQRFVDRWSTTEADEKFTPKRNMYLYGIGYAAASIDCTAAAVLPFVAYTTVAGDGATMAGLAGLMLSVLLLMTAVTMLVGLGRTMFIDFLRRATGMIKMVGAWMMTFAGIGHL